MILEETYWRFFETVVEVLVDHCDVDAKHHYGRYHFGQSWYRLLETVEMVMGPELEEKVDMDEFGNGRKNFPLSANGEIHRIKQN